MQSTVHTRGLDTSHVTRVGMLCGQRCFEILFNK